jgi:hypothetical protein
VRTSFAASLAPILNPNFPVDHKPPFDRPEANVVTDHPHAGI